MILVTGATGQLGQAVIAQLLHKTAAGNIAALTRDAAKAAAYAAAGVAVRIGDYDDTASLERAMQGVDRVLLIAGTDEERRVQQHAAVIEAAKAAGVRCVAYTSRNLRDPATLTNQLMLGHFQTEDYLRASGVGYIIFRNALYLDTVPLFVPAPALATGRITLPAGDGRVAYALRAEQGEAMANVLVDGPCDNRTYYLTGAAAYSFADVAAALTELTGTDVQYAPAEVAAFGEQLRARGVPEAGIRRTVGFMTDIKNGQEAEVSDELADLLGRPPTGLREGLKVLYRL